MEKGLKKQQYIADQHMATVLHFLTRRARSLLWFNPEPPSHWGSGNSDMREYIPVIDGVHQVSNLRQLGQAVDRLLA
jgi:uncharacterized protein with von Willebrand factor type A (vWA) domain